MTAIVEPLLRQVRPRAAGFVLALAAMASVSGVASAWTIERVEMQSQNEGVQLRLEASDPTQTMEHDVFTLTDPPRVVIDLFGADAPVSVATPKGESNVLDVRSSLWKDDASGRIVRYVVETATPMVGTAFVNEGRLTLALLPASATTPAAPAFTQSSTTVIESPASAQSTDEHGMNPYLALDAANAVAKGGAAPNTAPHSASNTTNKTNKTNKTNTTNTANTATTTNTTTATNVQTKNVDPLGPGAYDQLMRVEDMTTAEAPQTVSPENSEATTLTPTVTTSVEPTAELVATPAPAPTPAVNAPTLQAPNAQTPTVNLPDFASTAMKYAEPLPTRGAHGYYFPGDSDVYETPDGNSSNSSNGPGDGAAIGDSQDAAPVLGDADPRYAGKPPSVPFAGAALAQAGNASATSTRAMSLDVQSADLRTVFRSIAEFGGTNIVADREIEGPISIRLSNVPWRHALDIVCRAAGLVAVDGDGFIRVATIKAFRDEALDRESADRKREEFLPVETRIFHANYANAEELKPVVLQALSLRGRVEVDPRTNAVIVSDISSRLDQVGEMVSKLDTETRQVEILAQLIDVDAAVSKQLGISWDLDNLHSTAERISGGANVDESITAGASGALRVGVVRDWATFTATLEAFERSNQANIISNPKITTTNNRTAKILVGKEIPLIVLDERGNPITELKKVGITLEVTPFINSDTQITMDLHPEVSDLSSQATVTGGLIFTTAQADTRVMVGNGETAVIGGLVRTNETDFKQGIPILSDIPILGSLFRYTDDRDEKRELIILVTPSIVEPFANR